MEIIGSFGSMPCCIPDAKEGGIVLGVGAMEAGDIRGSAAMAEAYRLGQNA